MKNKHNFQASVTEKCTTLSQNSGIFQQNLPEKNTCEKVKSLKKLYYTWTSSQVAFKVSSKIFLTYLQKPVCIIYGISSRFYYS